MHDFDYDEAGQLCCAEVPLEKIAREIGTPYYCYSLPTLRRHIQAFRSR
jgi:diaminopimelate decarboxylase